MPEQTDTDIANFAMDLLSETPMTDIGNPNGVVERRIARLYEPARDLVLKKHWWSHARSVDQLVAVDNVADPQYSTVFQLPDDCLLIWTLGGRQRGHTRLEGPGAGYVASNHEAPVTLLYGKRLAAERIPVEIALYIGAELAWMASTGGGIELSKAKRDTIRQIADEREDNAVDICGTEGGDDQPFESRYLDAFHGVCPQRGGSA